MVVFHGCVQIAGMILTFKEKKRLAKKNLIEARNILRYMEDMLNGNDESIDMACAFFRMLNWHLESGDLRPSEVHLAALLRSKE